MTYASSFLFKSRYCMSMQVFVECLMSYRVILARIPWKIHKVPLDSGRRRSLTEATIVSWKGAWTPLATVHIPKQQFLFADQLQFCTDLSFSPWHSLPAHKPLGSVNSARRVSASWKSHTETVKTLAACLCGKCADKVGAEWQTLCGTGRGRDVFG